MKPSLLVSQRPIASSIPEVSRRRFTALQTLRLAAALCLCGAASHRLAAEPEAAVPEKEGGEEMPIKKEPLVAVPKEAASVTHHQIKVGETTLSYTATAGNLVIHTGSEPIVSMFYVAYALDGVKNLERRPVTFFYNGGPGSSSMWLHMGSFGPRKVDISNAAPTGPAPYRVIDNPNTLLDRSDLVFIDAPSTGFSKIVGKGKGKEIWSVDGDVDAFSKLITRWVTVNRRWNSPKVLFGESYGTTRSAALVYHLQQQGMYFNGVVLLSSVLNYESLVSPGLDEPYVNILPTYAAIAWYHDKLPHKPSDLPEFLQQVRDYASGDYAQALAKGHTLPAAQLDAVAARLHEITGLSVQYLKEANLRVRPGRFRKELLRDERRTVGRYDGRYEGIDFDDAGEAADSDPASTAITGAFTAAFNSYVEEELNYSHDTPYQVRSGDIKPGEWDFKHKLPEFMDRSTPYPMAYVVQDLGQAMRENPHLKVLSANGYFDLATPFYGTERDLDQMELDASLRDNVSFRYYPSGHMVYLNPEAHKAFREDLAKFYDSAAQP